ncbi:efflux RND transporter periplasmic adaptor subunit [Defluviimonas sp. WL0002]|uniref:Efflux RND transporter periplasmic adaptor subunit n=1 Tax=Albidovulum marisflavi TaxID=2984159 RepID=A0ABT2ZB04_9RHOB|nr:efflux RND transporter periplasmic adaptor subunit [Defluviimonas sp. WL0002]MCV2868319.1 efflux RND transporter periplasmic adaptor subunit [Defluviimonas sp. WL0002]
MFALPAFAETVALEPQQVTEWKPVYGRVEAKETVPARARIGGTVTELSVSEGDVVESGQEIARVHDDKISFQIAALDAQIEALQAQLATAEAELKRGEALLERGVTTAQRLDQLRTSVDVTRGQILATEAQRDVVEQQAAEGQVLAPAAGRILTVPVTKGAVILPGEPIATVGGGGFFLRLAIPERHAAALNEGAALRISTETGEAQGRIAKLYPQIENGRVIADVEVEGLDTAYVGLRLLVTLPVGSRMALLVPEGAVETRGGIDFVELHDGAERAVVLGESVATDEGDFIEVLTGLVAGDKVVAP